MKFNLKTNYNKLVTISCCFYDEYTIYTIIIHYKSKTIKNITLTNFSFNYIYQFKKRKK